MKVENFCCNTRGSFSVYFYSKGYYATESKPRVVYDPNSWKNHRDRSYESLYWTTIPEELLT